MIYHVVIEDEYGHPIYKYRTGAWTVEQAKIRVNSRIREIFGNNRPDIKFRLIHGNRIVLNMPDISDAARDFELDMAGCLV